MKELLVRVISKKRDGHGRMKLRPQSAPAATDFAFAAITSSRNRAVRVSICTSFAPTTPKRSVAGGNIRKRNRELWQIDSRYLPIGGFGGLGGNGSGGGVGVGGEDPAESAWAVMEFLA